MKKTDIYVCEDGFEITYSDILDKIIDSFYQSFRVKPTKSSIIIGYCYFDHRHVDGYKIEDFTCEFCIKDTCGRGLVPKPYVLDYFHSAVYLPGK